MLAAHVDLGPWGPLVALGIAVAKGSLVALYFMHLRWGARLDRLFAVAGIVWFAILAGLTVSEVLTRGWRTSVF